MADPNPAVYSLERQADGQRLVIIHNLSAMPVDVDVDPVMIDLKTNQPVSGTLTLPAFGYAWLVAA